MELPDNRKFVLVYTCDGPKIHDFHVEVSGYEELGEHDYELDAQCPHCFKQNISGYVTLDRIEVLMDT